MTQAPETQLFSRFDQICASVMNEAKATKTRKDPKCWKGKKIGKPKTKVTSKGVRVNNCVPAEESVQRLPGRREFSDPEEFEELKKRLLASGMDAYMKSADQKIDKVINQLSDALTIDREIDEDDRKLIQTYLNGDYEDDLGDYIDDYEMGLMQEKNATCTGPTQKASSTSKGKKYMKCVKSDSGGYKRIHWGQKGAKVTGKSGNTKRKKSFRARHKCSSAKANTPRGQACKDW